ncbi:MAG: aminotransferase class V-fold PLP-dependent enzyme [Patescibacteria group bacterium]
MKLNYFTVGPSNLHPKFGEFIEQAGREDIGSISHRGEKFMELYEDLSSNLKKLLNIPDEYYVFYACSATEFMERVVQNCSEKNTLHFVDGYFSKKFSEISKDQGRVSTEILAREDRSFSLEDIPSDCDPELICMTHNETTNGVLLPNSFLEKVYEKFPDKLIALDIVSSAPVCDVDFSKVDCAFFSVQKGFGLPAGLGVLFVSPRALKKAEEIEKKNKQYTGSYHSFASFLKYSEKNQTPETPNVFGMYLLNEVCKDYLSVGVENLKSEIKVKAKLIYSTLEKCKELKPLINNKEMRSETVIVAETKNGSKKIIESLKEKGFLVASGYGEDKEKQIRLGNFPSHSRQEVEEFCRVLKGLVLT